MPAPRLIVFDWDGTLVDSVAHIVRCLQSASRDAGLPEPDDAAARDVIGLGLAQTFARLFPEGASRDQLERMATAYRDHYLAGGADVGAPFPGVGELLEDLRIQGFRLAVATGKSYAGLSRAFAQTGLGDFFETIRCADERLSKPDPLMLREVLAETGVQHTEALMVGDSVHDLDMARAASVGGIGVTSGAHDAARLRTCEPLACLAGVNDLRGWLGPRV